MTPSIIRATESGDLRLDRIEVRRARLVQQLRAAADVPVVLVVGGAGEGKTTGIAQWLRDDRRSVAWLTVERRHDDPAVLLADIVNALDEFEPLAPRALEGLSAAQLDFSSVLLPRLEQAVAVRGRPFVFVFDDVHLVRRRRTLELVQALANCVPSGSQVVLVGRSEPALALARMRADRRLHTVRRDALAFDLEETRSLLAAASLSLPPAVSEALWARTEGWAVGVYFAALAMSSSDDPVTAAATFAGDDRLVVEYVRDEILGVLPPTVRERLVQVSVLDDLTAAACDHVLERDDSNELLEAAARSCTLIVPLDRSGDRYRMHHLMRDALHAQLVREAPETERTLHLRAADWYQARGDLDRAVDHALDAGDVERAEALVWVGAPRYLGTGLTATVERWLERFDDDAIAGRAALAVSMAWCAVTRGDMTSVRYWADVTSRFPEGTTLPDGWPAAGAAALLRASVGSDGIDAMRRDAERAYELHEPGSAYRALACYLEGSALRILGRRAGARARLEEGVTIGSHLLPSAQCSCLAELAMIAIDDDDWREAAMLVERCMVLLDRFGLSERPAQSAAYAVAALVCARSGDSFAARRHAKHSIFLASMLSTVAPWLNIDLRMLLARAWLLLGDVALARVLVQEADDMLRLVPDGDGLRGLLDDLRRVVDAERVSDGALATPLTPAELRVLRYLPTHLTFAAIADELFVSRNTVKTQVISVYRKLNVSSRGPAVEAARALGLLDD